MAYFTASCDTVEKNTAFAKELKLDYPILSDPTGKAAKAYGIYNGKFSSRTTFVIGADGKILDIDNKVKAASHGKDVAASLDELEVPEK